MRKIEMQEDARGTRMRSRIIVLALLITSCSSNRFLAPAIVVDETNSFVELTDKKARAVKLKSLRDKTIIEGNKEIRVWVGFGIVSSEDLLILKVDKKGKVTGRKILIYNRDPENWEGDEEALNEFLEGIYIRCDVIGIHNHIESCGLKKNQIYDWSKIYNKMEKLDIWTLPDESALPQPEILILDGFSLVVELREGYSYRAYRYGNPGFRKEDEAVKASEIMSFVMGL